MREIPKEHQIYRHFKGNLYQIITIAKNSETEEEMVVYRPIYNDTGCWVRELSMFMSEVDREKYPDAGQKYRFTRMDRGRAIEEDEAKEPDEAKVTDEAKEPEAKCSEMTDTKASEVEKSEGLNPLLEQFLDAGSYQEKLDIFYLMKKKGTKDMLSYVAMSLDIEISQTDDFDEQYREILNCLKTMEKYECNRLRS